MLTLRRAPCPAHPVLGLSLDQGEARAGPPQQPRSRSTGDRPQGWAAGEGVGAFTQSKINEGHQTPFSFSCQKETPCPLLTGGKGLRGFHVSRYGVSLRVGFATGTHCISRGKGLGDRSPGTWPHSGSACLCAFPFQVVLRSICRRDAERQLLAPVNKAVCLLLEE